MTFDEEQAKAAQSLRRARDLIQDELRAYPTPVSGCDAQYNHLIARRNAVTAALDALQSLPFVATPRSPSPDAGVESR